VVLSFALIGAAVAYLFNYSLLTRPQEAIPSGFDAFAKPWTIAIPEDNAPAWKGLKLTHAPTFVVYPDPGSSSTIIVLTLGLEEIPEETAARFVVLTDEKTRVIRNTGCAQLFSSIGQFGCRIEPVPEEQADGYASSLLSSDGVNVVTLHFLTTAPYYQWHAGVGKTGVSFGLDRFPETSTLSEYNVDVLTAFDQVISEQEVYQRGGGSLRRGSFPITSEGGRPSWGITLGLTPHLSLASVESGEVVTNGDLILFPGDENEETSGSAWTARVFLDDAGAQQRYSLLRDAALVVLGGLPALTFRASRRRQPAMNSERYPLPESSA
jgi:hypothetical protein